MANTHLGVSLHLLGGVHAYTAPTNTLSKPAQAVFKAIRADRARRAHPSIHISCTTIPSVVRPCEICMFALVARGASRCPLAPTIN